jgi:hypothetical protein
MAAKRAEGSVTLSMDDSDSVAVLSVLSRQSFSWVGFFRRKYCDILSLQKIMWRAILLLMFGIFCTALFLAAISGYVFHDVDQDKIGHWNEAFGDLFIEAVVFSLIISGAVWLLALLGRQLFNLRGYSPRTRIGLSLGIATAVFQYPFEFVGRRLVPNLARSFLSFYLVAAIFLCTAVLLRDTLKQRKLRKHSNLRRRTFDCGSTCRRGT